MLWKSGVDSRAAAIVNRSGLRLTPRVHRRGPCRVGVHCGAPVLVHACTNHQPSLWRAQSQLFLNICSGSRAGFSKCYRDNSFASVVPASTEHWITVQTFTDESVSARHQRSSMRRRRIRRLHEVKTKPCSVASHPVALLREPTVPAQRFASHGEQIQTQAPRQFREDGSNSELTGGVCELARHQMSRTSTSSTK